MDRARRKKPPAQPSRGHWWLLALCLVVLAAMLLVNGYVESSGGSSKTPGPAQTLSPVSRFGSVVGEREGKLGALTKQKGRRIVLTFDDGPDPVWTPRIAAALKRLNAPATFFVVGRDAARHPEIVESLRRDGFEIGNHTFTHVDLTSLPSWQRRMELESADGAVSGAAGVRPRMFRPPYSSEPDAVSTEQGEMISSVAGRGYVVMLSDFDSKDWSKPGVREIVRASTPPGRTGGIVLMHDGGGNRAQTVQALEVLIPTLRRRGFEIVPASEYARLAPAMAEPRSTRAERVRGDALIGTVKTASSVTTLLTLLLVPIALLAIARALMLVVFARKHTVSVRSLPRADEDFTPPVSFIVPAYNEHVDIERSVRSLAASDYPEVEVVVVDDGSDDGTAEIVESLGLECVRLIRQANAGKPAALNRGIGAASHDMIITVDADTVFEPKTLRQLVRPFSDPAIGAASGNTKVGNRRGLLGRWQHIEYVIGFNLDRRLYDVLNCMPTIPGAIGAFRRSALESAGGFSGRTLAEDTDITIAVGRAGWRVVYVEDACAWTEAPATVGALWRQRYRWSYGTMQAVWHHRRAVVRRPSTRIGRVGIPYLVSFQIMLPLLAPVIDVMTLYGIFFLSPALLIGYWLFFNLLQLSLGAYALRLDREPLRPLWALPLQQFVYRQLMYLVIIESLVSAVKGVRLGWQRAERTGDIEIAR